MGKKTTQSENNNLPSHSCFFPFVSYLGGSSIHPVKHYFDTTHSKTILTPSKIQIDYITCEGKNFFDNSLLLQYVFQTS